MKKNETERNGGDVAGRKGGQRVSGVDTISGETGKIKTKKQITTTKHEQLRTNKQTNEQKNNDNHLEY